MSSTVQTLLETPSGFQSPVVAAFFAGLEDLSRRLHEATRELTPERLEWQAAPGMNTVGMLLAHIAVAEVHLVDFGVRALETSDVQSVIGIRIEDDGLPLAKDGLPPESLHGKPLAFFDDLLARARAHTRRHLAPVGDGDLTRQAVRKRPDGTTRVFSLGWMVYHLLEHEAGHLGQILMLIHLRDAR